MLLALAIVAAPAPFLEPELHAVFRVCTPARVEALSRRLKAPDLALAVQPGQGPLPAAFLSRITLAVSGGQAVLRLSLPASLNERLLFRRVVAALAAPPPAGKELAPELFGWPQPQPQPPAEEPLIVLRSPRIDPAMTQRVADAMADIDIRENPPRLLSRPLR